MRFLFTAGAVLEPGRDAHREFVERHATTALCLTLTESKLRPGRVPLSTPSSRLLNSWLSLNIERAFDIWNARPSFSEYGWHHGGAM
jgi:hypothetical protein